MDLSKEPRRGRGPVADFQRNLIRKITDKTVAELAQEMGISPADLPKWSLMVKRAEKMAASFEKTLVPASRAREREGEIEELRRPVGKQAVVLEIQEKKGKT
ncbi:MAG TPA: transposase [Thermoanaerobaculia bacterium]